MKKVTFILVLALLFALLAAPFAYAYPSKKPIRALVERGSNYIFHVLAISRVGFNSDYAYIYKDMVMNEDKDYLYKHRDELTFGNGKAGELVSVMIMFPAYLNLETKEDIRGYFSALEEGFNGDNFRYFLEKYQKQIEDFNKWPFNNLNEEYLNSGRKYKDVVKRIGEIYLRNYDVYDNRRIWEVEKGKMERSAAVLNDYLKYADLIAKWEKLLGIEFKFDHYDILLCSAIEGGPDANSLSYERNVFYGAKPFSHMSKLVSHETGTHLLIDVFMDIYNSKKYNFDDFYSAFEILAEFYSCKILKSTYYYNVMGDNSSTEAYMKIYDNLYNQNEKITPKDLLTAGLDEFLKQQAEEKEKEALEKETKKEAKKETKSNKKK